MKKGITYNEKDLVENLQEIQSIIDEISFFYGMVYEQLDGKRSNIEVSWMKREYEKLEKISKGLNNFEIVPLEMKSLDSVLKELEELEKTDIY